MTIFNTIAKTFFLSMVTSSLLFSATISLTSPTTPVNVKDGDEFFTDVVHDPIDFDKRRDFMWEENFNESTISTNNSIWSGNNSNDVYSGGSVYPLFQGVPGAMNVEKTGLQFPINTSKYQALSIASNVSDRSVSALRWTRDQNWPDGSLAILGWDCYYTNTLCAMVPDNDWAIYLYDLSSYSNWIDFPVTGVRHDISDQATIGSQYQYKWFRIFDPSTSPTVNITWSTADVPSSPTGQVPHVKIYVDDDATGLNGTLIANVRTVGALQQTFYTEGSYPLKTASLPSGTYYFYLKLYDNIAGDTLLATSGYSEALTINTKSTISFEHPSMSSGPDYATEVLGNPWDMASASDVANLDNPGYQKDFTNYAFINDAFEATAVKRDAEIHSDVQVWLPIDPSNPIDPVKYHYFSYTMSVDPTYYGNISDKVSRGWVSRLIWWNQDISIDGSDTQDNVVYEGTHTYSVDLKTVALEPEDNYAAQTGWLANGTVENFRIDPLEISNVEGTRFYIHDAKLTGDPEPLSNGNFTASFNLADPENDTINVELYLDTDKLDFNGIQVGTGSFAPGNNTMTFSTCNLSAGNYYLYAALTDSASNVTQKYADVPISISKTCVSLSPGIISYLLD